MDTDIRLYIINNFKDSETSEIEQSIQESIKSNDEVVLPGLGVMLELLWKHSDDELKKVIVDHIHAEIKRSQSD